MHQTPWQAYQNLYKQYPVVFFLDSITFRKPNQNISLIGCDIHSELKIHESALKRPAAALRKIRKFISSGDKQVFGYFGYESAGLFESIKFRKKKQTGYPLVYLVKFNHIYRYDHAISKWLGGEPRRPARNARDGAKFEFRNFKAEISKKDFLKKIIRAKKYIGAGDIYQANLSQKFTFDYTGSPLAIYGLLRHINPSPFSSFLKIRDLQVASASPERLIQKKGSWCETRPIAGTCARTTNHGPRTKEELASWKKNLLGSAKERAEHLMLVDLERNDLGRVCDYESVKVDEFMTLEKYSHVVHLVSSVTGKLRKDKDGLDLFAAMFPGGTITGCPKIHCMEIIDMLEPSRRGLYTGSIGYFTPSGNLDWNIVIRTLVFSKGKGSFQVGAGIVHDSDPEKEYKETLAKGEALMHALANL